MKKGIRTRKKIREKFKSKLGTHKRNLRTYIVLFSPTYVAVVALTLGYLCGLVETFGFALFLIYGVIALVLGLLLQKSYPTLFPYLGRNVYHSVGGILIIIGSMFFLKFTTLILVLFCIFLTALTGFVLERAGIETLFSKSRTLRYVKDFKKSSHYEAGTSWVLSCLLLLLLFDTKIAYASILILAIGDTAAGFVGRNMGRAKNPLNPKKTIEGTLAFFATSLFAAMLFIPTQTALIVAFTTAIVEALPLRLNDNLTVPLSAGMIIYLLTLF